MTKPIDWFIGPTRCTDSEQERTLLPSDILNHLLSTTQLNPKFNKGGNNHDDNKH